MIEINKLCIRTGSFALSDITFAVPTAKYAVLMGKTGCGKTTILEAICGIRPVASGAVLLDGCDVTHLPPAVRGIGYVPQDGALFSRMSVVENLSFPMRIRGEAPEKTRARVNELLGLLGIEHLVERGVNKLSGGERQRVALGRALCFQPSVILLDEPISALDEDTREDMCVLLRSLPGTTGCTILHVTHSQAEAEQLADYTFRLENNAVKQVASRA